MEEGGIRREVENHWHEEESDKEKKMRKKP